MFIVEKAQLSSHFRSFTKKSKHVPRNYQLDARSFDEKVIVLLKTLDLAPNSSEISLSWMSTAVSFLSTVHSEAEDQISNLKSEADDYQALYMEYSLKVLDLCNLISSAVQRLTDRRLLMNFSLRLLNFTDQIPSPEKLNKAKDALGRLLNDSQESAKEKGRRAKDLMEELAVLLVKLLPRSKTSSGRDLIRRTFYALGVLTVFVGSVFVAVLYGDFDVIELRVPAEFLWADSVNGVRTRIFDLIKPKQNGLLELGNVTSQAVVVRDLLQVVVSDGGDNVDDRVRLEDGVKELGTAAKKFSDGIDALTNGVNGMFRTVLKTRNGRLDI
ncbi:uncharacterized protein LOC112523180 [Cynara cardunculus var. scolymus]|uniref:BYPASS-related protein n=1 Tax=Cynara cardunculus var. scolymus TaxID=59895 RepID=A0A118JYB7_CYNCS|nr:uncharacterized protein LOC112523180 [Cynara cardunculus var. scolymus]KVH97567.1 BYPASS-related protein [Cynara cardunculus var. scolymus]